MPSRLGSTLAALKPSRPIVPEPAGARRRYRTIWISDVHLGTRGCNAAMLIDFLDAVDSETMYLVGDIIDGWRLKKRFYWPPAHNDVVWRILKRAKRGTRIVYIPGNHDEMFRQFAGLDFGGVAIRRKAVHETADGRRLLVLHGDEFDVVTLAHRWLAHVGDAAYGLLMRLNVVINAVRRRLDLPYWSLSKHAKARVKNAVEFISRFEEVVAHAAGLRGVDGVVCGHIHTAEMRAIGGVAYYNDGDWVESCTALVEHDDGRIELLNWVDEIAARKPAVLPAAAWPGMRIAIVTDAWTPQVNGVVRTLQSVIAELERLGHQVLVVAPDRFRSVPCPTYPEIRLALAGAAAVGRLLAGFAPDAIHLATEGPLCLAARRWCLARRFPFTTAYHTQFPDYVAARTGMNREWVWRYIRWFHAPAEAVLASTPSIRRALAAHGIGQVRHWGRGVDLAYFRPGRTPHPGLAHLPRPILLHVGRVAVEKNVEAFLETRHPGTRIVVGDGPARAALERRYPQAIFMGARFAGELASLYAGADALVFPSRTDTFGLVMIEALACGTPVAAYPVAGPIDVLTAEVGAMHDDLDTAIAEALTRDRAACAAYGAGFTWEMSAAQFVEALAPLGRRRAAA